MKIQSIELYHVAMPVIYPFCTAFDDVDCIESVLVRMVREPDMVASRLRDDQRNGWWKGRGGVECDGR